jgi:hypothetical protein
MALPIDQAIRIQVLHEAANEYLRGWDGDANDSASVASLLSASVVLDHALGIAERLIRSLNTELAAMREGDESPDA